jgi:hypothetical protein
MVPVKFALPSWCWFALALLLLGFSVTGESLWVDEARTHRFSSISEIGDFIRGVATTPNSEAQMPGYLFLAWVADKALGSSEWAMRAQNYFWGALALFFFWRSACRLGSSWMVLFFALHPFLWFYMDEARPYAMQIALGAWMMDLLLRLQKTRECETRDALEWGVMVLMLCSSTLLGVIPAFCAGVIFLILCWNQKWMPRPPALGVFAVCLVLLLGLGSYYGWTLAQGAGGITEESPSWRWSNLAFSIYEFMGFGGLGPGRTELREIAGSGVSAMWKMGQPFLPAMCLLALGWTLSLVVSGLAGGGADGRRFGGMLVGLVLGTVVLIFLASRMTGFAFWGRHFSPLLGPVLLGLLLMAKPSAVPSPRRTVGLLGLAFLGVGLAWSSWQIRTSQRHQKEDYRTAARVALDHLKEDRKVLWAADFPTAAYYGLKKEDWAGKLEMKSKPGQALISDFDPDVVFLSKPKDFDTSGTLRRHVGQESNRPFLLDEQVNYFLIWRRF